MVGFRPCACVLGVQDVVSPYPSGTCRRAGDATPSAVTAFLRWEPRAVVSPARAAVSHPLAVRPTLRGVRAPAHPSLPRVHGRGHHQLTVLPDRTGGPRLTRTPAVPGLSAGVARLKGLLGGKKRALSACVPWRRRQGGLARRDAHPRTRYAARGTGGGRPEGALRCSRGRLTSGVDGMGRIQSQPPHARVGPQIL